MTVDESLEAADRAGRVLMWLTFALMVVVVATTVMVLAGVLDVRARSDALALDSEIDSCRVRFQAAADTARVDALVLVLDGLVAVAAQDRDALLDLSERVAPTVRAEIEQARADYDLAVRLAREDPAAFLEECRTR